MTVNFLIENRLMNSIQPFSMVNLQILIQTPLFSVTRSGPFEIGFDILNKQMLYLSADAKDYYQELKAKTQLSKEADDLLDSLGKSKLEVENFLNSHVGGDWHGVNYEVLKKRLEKYLTDQKGLQFSSLMRYLTEKMALQEADEVFKNYTPGKAIEFLEKYKVPPPKGHKSWMDFSLLNQLEKAVKDYQSTLPKSIEEQFKKTQECEKNSTEANEVTENFVKIDAEKDKVIAFLNRYYPKPPGQGNWNGAGEGQLRAGIEAFKTSQSDFVAESQLKIQRVMQTYNTTATLFNSLQVMLADMNKMVAQTIR